MLHWENLRSLPVLPALLVIAALVALYVREVMAARRRKQLREERNARHRQQLLLWNALMWTRSALGLSRPARRLTDQREEG